MSEERKQGDESDGPAVFGFDGMLIEMACWLDGEPYFTAEAIGRALAYKDPGRDVRRLVARNPYICEYRRVTVMNVVIRSARTERATIRTERRGVSVYSLSGLQLIVFESDTVVARRHKVAVAKLMRAAGDDDFSLASHVLSKGLSDAVRIVRSMRSAMDRAAFVSAMAEREGVSRATIHRRLAQAGGSLMPTVDGRPRKPRSDRLH